MSSATLEALRTASLETIKSIVSVGQSHSLNGRSMSAAQYDSVFNRLADIEAALQWKSNTVDGGNIAFASRFTNFGTAETP